MSSGEIPWPLSEISISTASPSLSARVATRSWRIVEFFHRLRRVVDQVRQHAPHQFRIGFHRRQRSRQLRSHVNAVEPPVKQLQRAFDDRIQIRGSKPRGREARELRELIDERFSVCTSRSISAGAFRRQFLEFRTLQRRAFRSRSGSR